MSTWYYTDGKEQYGPFSAEQLRGKGVSPRTLVWTDGMISWEAAETIPELQGLLLPLPGPAMAHSSHQSERTEESTNWYFKCLRHYADFKGRARRREYWVFSLVNMVLAFFAVFLDSVLGTHLNGQIYGLIYIGFALVMFLPGLAAGVRRLHDIDKSGWMLLVSLIPIIGAIWILVLLLKESDAGANRFGPSPKGGNSAFSPAADRAVAIDCSGDTTIMLVICWMAAFQLFSICAPILGFFSQPWFRATASVITLTNGVIPLVLATTVKGTTKRIVLLIISVLYLASALYRAVQWFL